MAGFLDKNISNALIRRIRKFNDGGWDYVDKVVRKSNAVGRNEYIERQKVGDLEEDFSAMLYDIPGVYRSNKGDSTYDSLKTEYKKDEYLEEISGYDEIDFVITTIANESIIYDEEGMFCSVNTAKLQTKFSLRSTVLKTLESEFNKLYFLWRFNDNDYAWRLFKEWLIFGKIAFEIIYNDNKTSIIGFKRLDPYSLEMKIEKIGGKFVKYWIQYKNQQNYERQLADDEVIYITYNESKNRKSYLETILRNFNLLRTLEDTRAIWGVMHSTMRMRMIVPVSTKSEQKVKVKVGELRNRYKENIEIDKTSGQITHNGKTNLPLMKNYIFPRRDGEEIEIEPIIYPLSDAISTDELEYFARKFKTNTKIPLSRFERESGGSTFDLSTSIENEEIAFGKFINRLRNVFKELILKPFKIQMKLIMPELVQDTQLWNSINVIFNKNNLFELLKEMELMEKKADFISTLSGVTIKKWDNELQDFAEEPFFSSRYLIERYMDLSQDEMARNLDYKLKYGEVKPEDDPADGTETDTPPDNDSK